MTINYRIEKKDILNFHKYARFHTPEGKRLIYAMIIWFALLALWIASGTDGNYLIKTIAFILCLGISLLFTLFLNWAFTHIVQWRLYTPEKQKGVLCEHTIILSEDWIIEKTDVNEDRKRWKGVYKIIDYNGYIFIFISPIVAHIIPKRYFQSIEHAKEFYNKAIELHQKSLIA